MRELIFQYLYGTVDHTQFTNAQFERLDAMIADNSIDAYRIKIPKDRYREPRPGEVLLYADRYAIACDERIFVNGKIKYPDSVFIEKDLRIRELELKVSYLMDALSLATYKEVSGREFGN